MERFRFFGVLRRQARRVMRTAIRISYKASVQEATPENIENEHRACNLKPAVRTWILSSEPFEFIENFTSQRYTASWRVSFRCRPRATIVFAQAAGSLLQSMLENVPVANARHTAGARAKEKIGQSISCNAPSTVQKSGTVLFCFRPRPCQKFLRGR